MRNIVFTVFVVGGILFIAYVDTASVGVLLFLAILCVLAIALDAALSTEREGGVR